ncbi:ABC transporter substrate-binding protein [Chloroflexota bacterium]
MKNMWYSLLVLGLAFSVVLSGCKASEKPAPAPAPTPAPAPAPKPVPPPAPPSAPTPSEWDKVLEAARKEGTVTIYNVLGYDLGEAITEGMKQYGIKVETVGGRGGELQQKIETEQRAGISAADTFITGFTNNLILIEKGHTMAPPAPLSVLEERGVWKLHPSKYEPKKHAYVMGTSLTPSIIINTDLVKEGEITSWNDLLDPKWKGKMVMTDGRTGTGPGAAGIGAWMMLGEDFWKKMAQQDIPLFPKYGTPVDMVAHGEKALAIFPAYSRTTAAIKAGAPVQIGHLKEGTSYYVRAIGLVKDAPHPNASAVCMNWMLTKEGQAAICSVTESYTVRNDVTEDWFTIPDLVPGTFTFMEPPNNLDITGSAKGAAFAEKIFGPK